MRRCAPAIVSFVVLSASLSMPASALDRLLYTALAQPCRLLDTRSPGPGPLTAAHGAYLLGASDADIESAAQNGNAAGCAVPVGASAVSVNFNLFNTTAAGNLLTWASGATKPAAGTAVYNPSVTPPAPGEVEYNTGTATIAIGNSNARFNLSVANGQADMTINIIGYWTPLAHSAIESGTQATSWGASNTSSGDYSTTGGLENTASALGAAAIGESNTASSMNATALGQQNQAGGIASLAVGYSNTVTANYAIALGTGNNASGFASVAMGDSASANNFNDTFVFGDGSGQTQNTAAKQFMARASGGVVFYSGTGGSGVQLAAGGGAWTSLSDRNAKQALQAIDSRDVLDRVVAMPLSTWQYKSQDAKYRHMGPMAQDFYAAFGLGESDTGIDTIDADGVALAAIQGLNAKLEAEREAHAADLARRDRQHDEDSAQIDALRSQIADLAAAVRQRAH